MGVSDRAMKLAYRPAEAARALGISKRTLYRRLAAGEIRSRLDGGVRLIPSAELERVAGITPSAAEYPARPAVRVSEWSRESLRMVRR